jgi:hypothetical protein
MDATVSTDAGDGGNGAVCTSACMAATGCPAQSCYVPTANPVPASGLFMIPDNKLLPPYAIDGNLATRYTTGANGAGTEWFQVDLCRTATISGVNLNDTTDPLDVAAAYNVQVSLDGTMWTTVATSTMPAAVNLTVTFAPTMARYVRFNQTGMVGVTQADGGFMANWWSIDEFSVLCGAPDAGGDAAIESGASDAAGEAASDATSEATSDATGQ